MCERMTTLPKMKLFLAASTNDLATLFLLKPLCTQICRTPKVAFKGLSSILSLSRFIPTVHDTDSVQTSLSSIRLSISIRSVPFALIADVLPLRFEVQLVGDNKSISGIEISVTLTVADS